MGQDSDDKNIVDLAAMRRRQKTVRVDPAGRRKGAESRGKTSSQQKTWTFWGVVQLALFLGLFAFFLTLCNRGGRGLFG